MQLRACGAMWVLVLACAGSPDPSEYAFTELHAGNKVRLSAGQTFTVTLGAAQGVAPEFRYTWGVPQLTGDSLRMVDQELLLPTQQDGGTLRFIYTFEAIESGDSEVRVDPSHPETGWRGIAEPFVLVIEVV